MATPLKAAILGVPSSLAGPGPGPEQGPGALRELGLLQRLQRAGISVEDWGDVPVNGAESVGHRAAPATRLAAAEAFAEQLREQVLAIYRRSYLPVVVGGDHFLALGTISASAEAHPNVGVLWIDAHPDFNTLETSPTGNPHGMMLALLAGVDSRPKGSGLLTVARVSPRRIAMVGIRSVDPGEDRLVEASGISVWTSADVRRLGGRAAALEAIEYLAAQGCRELHVSLDLDVLEPGFWPGVATPAPDGISASEMVSLMRTAAEEATIVALDVVELDPPKDVRNQTARAAIQAIEAALATVAVARAGSGELSRASGQPLPSG